jgi:hypothetical protein
MAVSAGLAYGGKLEQHRSALNFVVEHRWGRCAALANGPTWGAYEAAYKAGTMHVFL